MSEEEKFDGILYQLVSATGGYEGFFDQVFGFLRRKTDFFADQRRAEETIAASGKKHIEAYLKDAKNKQTRDAEEKERQQRRQEKLKEETQAKAPEPKQPEAPKAAPAKTEEPTGEKPEGEEKSDKLKPNAGNGSATESYYWTQTLEEVQASIFIESGVRAKDLIIKLELEHCYIARKDKSKVYIDGAWPNKIHPDDSVWTIEETSSGERSVQLTLLKWRNTQLWWDCLIKGEPIVDTQKINPEPSKMSDLDGDMKATVGKMMFDMQQKQKGLPSSDELEKQEKLQAFMKAHPEMDFSKAKFA